MFELIVGLLIGTALGGMLVALFMTIRGQRQRAEQAERLAAAEAQQVTAEERETALRERCDKAEDQSNTARAQFEATRDELANLQQEHARLQQQLADHQAAAAEKLQLLASTREQAETELRTQFKVLAGEVLDKNADTFAKQHQTRLDALLKPFSERINAFEKQVKESSDQAGRERSTLMHELKRLGELNQRMSDEADNLTRALKGDVKVRGNWGEVILERVLEHAGLRRDHEFRVQAKYKDESGSRFYPDVIVDLPDDKHLVIDSKVSLISWVQVCEAEDDGEREQAIAGLVDSVTSHIRDLSTKQYQHLYGLETVDFVLLFIPVEAAFSTVVQSAPDLYRLALDKNIVIVSPTTLLATMRTIAMTWQSERQSRNALKIAVEAGRLHDAFALFTDSMQQVGRRIDQAQSSWDEAFKRLATGRGNLVRRTDQLRLLGARTAKKLGKDLTELAYQEEFEHDTQDLPDTDEIHDASETDEEPPD